MGDKKRVGFTCGAFDILHTGHTLMLKECKDVCDYLIVGLQIDPSVDRKSKNSPVQDLEERRIMLESIKYVDEIRVYKTERDLLVMLVELHKEHPDMVRILGADWMGRPFTGHQLKIRTYFNSRDHGYSSSSLRERIFLAEQQKRGES